jgi:circadian clock protein KaiC
MRERTPTGIRNFDGMIDGGIPSGNQVALAGGPGAGKTLLSFEIAYNMAKSGIPSSFISFEEEPESIIANAKEVFTKFKDIDELIEKKKLLIEGKGISIKIIEKSDSPSYSFSTIISDIDDIVAMNGSKFVVIDSISLLHLLIPDPVNYRIALLSLTSKLKSMGVTSILTAELPTSERKDVTFDPEFFTFDGIVLLYEEGEADKRSLTLEIVKMRGSNHSWFLAPYEIMNDGFNILTPTSTNETMLDSNDDDL